MCFWLINSYRKTILCFIIIIQEDLIFETNQRPIFNKEDLINLDTPCPSPTEFLDVSDDNFFDQSK